MRWSFAALGWAFGRMVDGFQWLTDRLIGAEIWAKRKAMLAHSRLMKRS